MTDTQIIHSEENSGTLGFSCPVLDLVFLTSDWLLGASGPFLKCFYIPDGRCERQVRIFRHQRIHRIVKGPKKIFRNGSKDFGNYDLEILPLEWEQTLMAFGEKAFRIMIIRMRFDFTTGNQSINVHLMGEVQNLCDWIIDGCWLYEELRDCDNLGETKEAMPNELVFVCAHNFIIIMDYPSLKFVEKIQCEQRCILYSARCFGSNRNNLSIASGTVFNKALLWIPNEKNLDGTCKVLREFIGHEGVIFGLRFSEDGNLLCTVSDDRTIRLWNLSSSDCTPSKTLYGHMGRVWDCIPLKDKLVSVSEDSSCRVWALQGSETECITCWEGHTGKSVWAVDVDPSLSVVATGGNDGGIRLWSLTDLQGSKVDHEEDLATFSLPNIDSYLPHDSQVLFPKKEFIRNFVQVRMEDVIVSTNSGCLLKYSKNDGWSLLHFDPELINYSMLSISKDSRVMACGSINGQLTVLSPFGEFEVRKCSQFQEKIYDIFIIKDNVIDRYHIFSFALNDKFAWFSFQINEGSAELIFQGYIEVPKHACSSGYLVIAADACFLSNVLVCGCRDGCILVYLLPSLSQTSNEASNVNSTIPIALQVNKAHDIQAVTSILISPLLGLQKNASRLSFYSTGRDGIYCCYHLSLSLNSQNEKKITVERAHRSKITKGWLEGLLIRNGEILALGFYQKRFFVYNDSKKYEMISVACGGAHRKWHFYGEDAVLSKASFSFIRREKILYFKRDHSEDKGFRECRLQDNYHGREVRSLQILATDTDSILFATSGEDGLLRLFQFNTEIGKIDSKGQLKKHSSMVRALCQSKGDELELLFSGGGCEELICWKLEYSLPHSGTDPTCLDWSSCPQFSNIQETRIMDIATHYLGNGQHCLGVAYSDSYVRIILFEESTRHFHLLGESNFHGHCVMSIISSGSNPKFMDNEKLFLSGGSDGRVAVWSLSSILQSLDIDSILTRKSKSIYKIAPLCHFRAHQSGVNTLSTLTKDTAIYVVSGGDDNAVVLTVLKVGDDATEISERNRDSFLPVLHQDIHSSAHSSSVVGVKILEGLKVVSTSTDQRVRVWDLNDDSKKPFLSYNKEIHSFIADISASDVALLPKDSKGNITALVGVTGIGIEFLKV